MILQRARFLLLSLTSRGLLKLQSWVSAALLRGYRRNNSTSLHLEERVAQLHKVHLWQSQIVWHLLHSRALRGNLSSSQKPNKGPQMSIQHLSRKEIEQAFAVVDAAWQTSDGAVVRMSVPAHLQHLRREDWERVSQVLYLLQHQKAESAVH